MKSTKPQLPATLKIRKFVRTIASDGATFAFYFLSNGKEPCFTQTYSKFNKACGHVEREFDTLAMFKSTGAYCNEQHLGEEPTDWLMCPICVQWFITPALNTRS